MTLYPSSKTLSTLAAASSSGWRPGHRAHDHVNDLNPDRAERAAAAVYLAFGFGLPSTTALNCRGACGVAGIIGA